MNYMEITFTDKTSLKLTPEHLFLAQGEFIPAIDIQVGSLLHNGKGGTIAVTKVKSGVAGRGLYAPLTQSGTLVVDGVQTSCYISLQGNLPKSWELGGWSIMSQHMFAHILAAQSHSNGLPGNLFQALRF
jgi:Hint module